jgi:hypothetical protein
VTCRSGLPFADFNSAGIVARRRLNSQRRVDRFVYREVAPLAVPEREFTRELARVDPHLAARVLRALAWASRSVWVAYRNSNAEGSRS